MPQFPDDPTGAHGSHAVAVLRDDRAAAETRDDLVRHGVPADAVQIGTAAGSVESLRAEMRAEMEEALVSPQAAVAYTKEGLKGVGTLALYAAAVGALLAIPVAVLAAPDWPLWLQIVVAVVVGSLAGGSIGLVGGAAAARGPAEPLAAERGVTLRVATVSPEVIEVLEAHDPLRVDVVFDDGTPAGEAVVEAADHSTTILSDRLLHQTDTDWDDERDQTRRERAGGDATPPTG